MGQDEARQYESDSDVSIEPYTSEWNDDDVAAAHFPDLVPDGMGEPLE